MVRARAAVVSFCVLAVMAVWGATGATALSAAPEWYECVKSKVGSFEKGCAKEGGKGGYVARAGLGAGGGSFEAKGSAVVLKAVDGHEITCSNFIEEGQRAMPNLVQNVTIRLKACAKTGTHQRCFGMEEGETEKRVEFESEPLSGELGYISRSPLKVGLVLHDQAEPTGLFLPRIFCPDSHFSERWRGSFVGEVTGVVNVSGKKAALRYALGPYLGEVSPGYTPETDPPLEGEEAGGLIEESKLTHEPWGDPLPGGYSGTLKIPGVLMVRA
ncbi:MAG TPA: hypothetical protein VGD00_11970 [Solirubrobacteraceae bacterium]|jgi:hypothetical protein